MFRIRKYLLMNCKIISEKEGIRLELDKNTLIELSLPMMKYLINMDLLENYITNERNTVDLGKFRVYCWEVFFE